MSGPRDAAEDTAEEVPPLTASDTSTSASDPSSVSELEAGSESAAPEPEAGSVSGEPEVEGGSGSAASEPASETGQARVAPAAGSPTVRIGASPGPPGRACPACGRHNDRGRELCRGCGVDLLSGERLPAPAAVDAAAVPAPGPLPRAPRRWWLPVLAVLLAGALAVGILVRSELGPFAPETGLPRVTLDPARYPGEPTEVPLADIATLTNRPPDGPRRFDALQLVDGDPTTAWIADARDRPIELVETIEAGPETALWLTAIVVRNGDQRSATDYEATSRVRQAYVGLDGGESLLVTLLDEGLTAQRVDLDRPVLTTTVRIEVLERYLGDHGDVALSELRVLGWPADAEDAALAAARAARQPAAGRNG